MLTLAWAAAATSSVGLGTSVLVLPQHHPLALANALASLDALSEGRLTIGAGVGWSEAEFAALGQDFHTRGRRTDEIIDVLRTCWRDDPATVHGEFYELHEMRVLPQPAHRIPIWVGGSSEAGWRRAVTKGDGFHAIGLTPDDTPAVVARIRRDRPEPEFTISLRTGWDPQGMEHDTIRAEHDAWEAQGIQYVVCAPWRTTVDDWLRSMELLADIVGIAPRCARCRVRDVSGRRSTRNAPRMNGCTRQKYVYVPGSRSVGVLHVSRPTVGAPASPSCPESNCTSASASGYAMPVDFVHGALHAVTECHTRSASASRFWNVMAPPAGTVGTSPASVRSPAL